MSSDQSTKLILVTGATGKQGRAIIDVLIKQASPDIPISILALTRDPNSPSAIKLANLPSVVLVKGDLSHPNGIFAQIATPIWGVFSVQVNSPTEESEGISFVNAAATHGVKFFVYASGDRGGPEKSDHDATNVKNFQAKFAIEKHLKRVAESSKMQYTIFRPVTFMENLTTDIHGKGFMRMWNQMGDKSLQLVSTVDIGVVAAKALLHPEAYDGRAITLAGDELTQAQADVIFKKVTGHNMEMAPCFIGKAVKWVKKDTVGDMFQWFTDAGYGGDVDACRRLNPDILDFEHWLRQRSGFVKRDG